MTPTEQIKAVAELDGWRPSGKPYPSHDGVDVQWYRKHDMLEDASTLPPYLTSYDAIRPVVKKLVEQPNVGHQFVLHLWEICGLQRLRGSLLLSRIDPPADFRLQVDKIWELFAVPTPAQIAEALLRAYGRWSE